MATGAHTPETREVRSIGCGMLIGLIFSLALWAPLLIWLLA